MNEALLLVPQNVGFGSSTHWQMPFALQCRLLGRSPFFSVLGRNRLRQSLLHLLCVRLKMEMLKRKVDLETLPDVSDKMLFIVGLPRCGSTLVHNLLSFDSTAATFDFAEMHDPSVGSANPGREVKTRLEKLKKAMPMLSKKANLKEGKKEDDSFLMQLSFLHPVLALACRDTKEFDEKKEKRKNVWFQVCVSRYRDWMYSANLQPFYEELKLLYRV